MPGGTRGLELAGLRLLLPQHARPGLRVFYGHDRVPGAGEPVRGGTAKFQRLTGRFPNHPTDFTCSTSARPGCLAISARSCVSPRRRGVPVVLNQDGVGYPAWAGDRADEVNRPLRLALGAADHVLYQSEFSKRSADCFSGSRMEPGRCC